MPDKTSTSARLRARARGLSGYFVVVAGTAGARAASFAATVIIARELGPSEFGDFTLFFAVMIPLIAATDFVDIIYVRQVNNPGEIPRVDYLRAALTMKVVTIGLIVLAAYPIAVVLATYVFRDAELAPVLVSAIVSGVFLGFVALWAATYLATGRYGWFGVVNSIYYVGILVAVVALAATRGVTATGVYVVFVSTSVVLGLVSLAVVARAAWPVRGGPAIRVMLRFARSLAIAEFLYVAFQRVDVMLLSRYVQRGEVGQLGAALRITVIASLMIGSMASFLLPRAARSRGSRVDLRRYLAEGGYLAGGLCLGIGVVWIAAPQIVTTFLGSQFEPATHLTRILLLGVALLALSTPLTQLLLSDDKPRHVPLSLLSKYTVLAVGTTLLAPRFGAEGAAWSYVASEAVALVYAGVIVWLRWNALPRRTEPQAGLQP